MAPHSLGTTTDPRAIGDGSIVGQLKRYTPDKATQVAVQPMWGVSRLRDTTTESNGGTVTSASGGEIQVSTDTTSNALARLQTKKYGRYRSGDLSEVGIQVRFPTDLSGGTAGQDIIWGGFTSNNGLGWGVDGTGMYVFRRDGGTENKVYQSSWNRDRLDGTDESGLDLDLSDGTVFHVLYGWYGSRPARFYAEVHDPKLNLNRLIEVHRIRVTGAPSVENPDLPIAVEVDNSGTSAAQDLFVGGRQYTLVGGGGPLDTRPVPAFVEGVSLSDDTWTPILAVQRKAQLNSRENTITAFLKRARVTADRRAIFRVEEDATIDEANSALWSVPTGWDAGETAIEVIRSTDTGGLTVGAAGLPTGRGNVVADRPAASSATIQQEIALGKEMPVVLYVQRQTANATSIYYGQMEVDEQW